VLNPHNIHASEKEGSWHLHKKIRKVARFQVSDAFELRNRVIVLMLAVVVGVVAGTVTVLRWLLERLWWGGV
jgi:hypothetical protein